MSHWVKSFTDRRSAASFLMLCIMLLGSFPASGWSTWECLDGTPCSSSMTAAPTASMAADCAASCCHNRKAPVRSCCSADGKKGSLAHIRSTMAAGRCVCRLHGVQSRQPASPQVLQVVHPMASLQIRTVYVTVLSAIHLTKFVEERGPPPSHFCRTASLRAPPLA